MGDLSRLIEESLGSTSSSLDGRAVGWWRLPREPGCASRPRLLFLLVGWCYCIVSWIVGAFVMPTLDIRIMPGTHFAQVITRSLAMTLVDLYTKRTWFSLIMLGFFSVAVPIVKLTCTLWLIHSLYLRPIADVYARHSRMIWILTYLASYQLIDLYVGILFVAFFNSDSADASFLEGFYWFFRYCIVSMVCSEVLAGTFPEMTGRGAELEASAESARASPAHGASAGSPARMASTQQDSDDAEEALDQGARQLGALADALRAGDAPALAAALLADAPRRYVDVPSARCFSACFVLLLAFSAGGPMLEVRTLWEGVAVDRSSRSLAEIFVRFLPGMTQSYVTVILVFMNVFLPLTYAVCLMVLAESSSSCLMGRWGGSRPSKEGDSEAPNRGHLLHTVAGFAAHVIRPWATADVFTFAALIFLFTVQDARTLTSTPEGSYDFYVFLGAGFSFFFLRWFTEVEEAEAQGSAPWNPRFFVLIFVWMLVCACLLGGVPGSSPHFDFPDLDSVCKNAMPLLNSTLRSNLPAAIGDCTSESSGPPRPCQGDAPLLNKTNDNGYIQAVWLGGIDTISLDKCHLWKEEPVSSQMDRVENIKYNLKIHGVFDRVRLFLHVRQCGPFGCTRLNSADNCCGDDIRFHLTFGMSCRPGHGPDAFQDVSIQDCKVDPMIVEERLLGGALEIDALDIAPQVEAIVKDKIAEFMGGARLLWSGQQMDIPQLLNHLIAYNSPDAAGSC